ncbi:MAG: MurR/RpiR family transcriptional regulator [Streptococcaceae bacterium]|jgi:DNA-binding MurR/RpiR family transcriptional regulator|nr:MurR/RpiR family transcriptional regulator [Streptococcaceae bacterium]
MLASLKSRIISYSDKFSKTDTILANLLINNSEKIGKLSIQELSKISKVSTATISRFAKKIGYDSYQDLKFDISNSNSNASSKSSYDFFRELNESDSYHDILKKNFAANIASLRSTEHLINEEQLQVAVNILLKSEKCAFFGLGASNAVALIAYHRFLKTPLVALYHQDFHYQQMIAAKLKKNDCAILISHTGKNRDVLQLVKILKDRQIPTIGITSFAGSPFAELVDVALISVAEETSYRPEALSSTVSQISVLDSLFMIYGVHMKSETNEALESIRRVIEKTRVD